MMIRDTLANRFGFIQVSLDEFPSPDELCRYMLERDHLTEDYRAMHRFQQVGVVRNDKTVHFERDLGSSTDFSYEGVHIPGEGTVGRRVVMVMTVGELMDVHEGLRHTRSFVEESGVINSNLVDRFLDSVDIKRRLSKGLKIFGMSSPHPDTDWRRVPDKGEKKEW